MFNKRQDTILEDLTVAYLELRESLAAAREEINELKEEVSQLRRERLTTILTEEKLQSTPPSKNIVETKKKEAAIEVGKQYYRELQHRQRRKNGRR